MPVRLDEASDESVWEEWQSRARAAAAQRCSYCSLPLVVGFAESCKCWQANRGGRALYAAYNVVLVAPQFTPEP